MINFRRWRRALYRRVVRLPGTADSVARGAAVGVIAGCVMPPGLQLVMGIPIALLVRGSVIAMIAFSFVSNPITYLPLYVFTCRVGQLFLNLCGSDVRLGSELADMVRQALELDLSGLLGGAEAIAACWVAGGLIVGLAGSVPAYYGTYALVVEFRRLRQGRQERRAARRRQLLAEEPPEERPATAEPDEEAADELPPPPPD